MYLLLCFMTELCIITLSYLRVEAVVFLVVVVEVWVKVVVGVLCE